MLPCIRLWRSIFFSWPRWFSRIGYLSTARARWHMVCYGLSLPPVCPVFYLLFALSLFPRRFFCRTEELWSLLRLARGIPCRFRFCSWWPRWCGPSCWPGRPRSAWRACALADQPCRPVPQTALASGAFANLDQDSDGPLNEKATDLFVAFLAEPTQMLYASTAVYLGRQPQSGGKIAFMGCPHLLIDYVAFFLNNIYYNIY